MVEVFEALQALDVDIDVTRVIFLMIVGLAIKKMQIFKKCPNSFIPLIVEGLSIVLGIVSLIGSTETEVNIQSICNTIVVSTINAALAIGFHQYGKRIFTKIKKVLSSSITDVAEDSEENTTDSDKEE